MNRSTLIAIAVVAVIAVAGVSAYFIYAPTVAGPQGTTAATSTTTSGTSQTSFAAGSGTLNLFIADAPPASTTLKYVLLNITSLALDYEGNVSATAPRNEFVFKVPSSTGTNINLTKLQGSALLLGATTVPAGNVTRIILNITGAKAFFTDGTSGQLKVVADGKLMIPFHFQVPKSGSVDLTYDIMPNELHISQGAVNVLTPVVRLTAVQKGQSTTTTVTTTTSVSSSTAKA